jgi:uncharacterized membrane protein
MRLFFQGELPTVAAFAIAVGIGGAVAWYYSRETRGLALPHRWLLPILRGLAIALVLLMLAGPMIEYRRETGSIPTVNVFVDVSDSMKFEDAVPSSTPQPPVANATGETGAMATETIAAIATEGQQNAKSRIDRAVSMLLGDTLKPGWIDSVKQTHRVKLFAIAGDSSQQVYDSASPEPMPKTLMSKDAEIDTTRTNIGLNLSNQVMGSDWATKSLKEDSAKAADAKPDAKEGNTQAIVLLSDGQHNSGESPEEVARRLGDISVPVFTIGLGQQIEPTDLAVLGVDAPSLVAATGRVSGSVSIKDLGATGKSFRLRLTSGEQVVWERMLSSENQANRRVPFDFAVDTILDKQRRPNDPGLDRSRVVIPLQATVEPIEGEYDLTNNSTEFRLSASTRTRRMLIVDSRSRWETRYIRNVFDRDPTWEVQTIMLWPDQSTLTALDEEPPSFPEDQKTLAEFDVIVWGDVDPKRVSNEQLILVRDFVSQGGGIVFVDGERDHLYSLKDSPLGDLVPVRFNATERITQKMSLSLTPVGSERAAMALLLDGASQDDNQKVWQELQAPSTIRQVEALPGSEVWLEARIDSADQSAPVMVTRLYGGGQVVYLATDQTWRWRYRVADLYHAKFWNQLLEAIMPPPFDVRDQYIALSTGSPQYQAGQKATIRVQMRDASGKAVTDLLVDAITKGDNGSEQITQLRLVDPARGIYQGESMPLTTGSYTTSVRASGYASSASVTSSFVVTTPPNRENFRLSQNVSLLTAMATSSGGVYADESEAQRVWDAIKPLSNGKIEVKKLAMAQSFVWFFAVLVLLAIEWWLRKKVGLV